MKHFVYMMLQLVIIAIAGCSYTFDEEAPDVVVTGAPVPSTLISSIGPDDGVRFVRGRNGDPRAGVPVLLSLGHLAGFPGQ